MSTNDARTTPLEGYGRSDSGDLGDLILNAGQKGPCAATQPASLPEDAWDVFRLDEDESSDEPEPGDFWVELDAAEDE
jgi:hypothetical protein